MGEAMSEAYVCGFWRQEQFRLTVTASLGLGNFKSGWGSVHGAGRYF